MAQPVVPFPMTFFVIHLLQCFSTAIRRAYLGIITNRSTAIAFLLLYILYLLNQETVDLHVSVA